MLLSIKSGLTKAGPNPLDMSQPVTKHNSSPKLTFAEELPPYLDKLVQTVGISTDIARILKQLGEERVGRLGTFFILP
jgi:hypothetical protein